LQAIVHEQRFRAAHLGWCKPGGIVVDESLSYRSIGDDQLRAQLQQVCDQATPAQIVMIHSAVTYALHRDPSRFKGGLVPFADQSHFPGGYVPFGAR
jgi:hypothetical protein